MQHGLGQLHERLAGQEEVYTFHADKMLLDSIPL